MYQTYKDTAQFYIVYIREAHASDGRSMQRVGEQLGIKNHTSYEERCTVAQRLFEDKKLTISGLVDGFDNKVNDAYQGWPTRLFLVRKDGKLGVAGGRGPWGLPPALKEAGAWLKTYKETGDEPALPKAEDPKPGDSQAKAKPKQAAEKPKKDKP